MHHAVRPVASVYLAVATVTTAFGAAPIALALSGRAVNLPDVVLDPDAVRGTALAMGSLVAALGILNAAFAAGVLRGSRAGWSGAVVASGVTATALGATLLGLVFQRGAGALPSADAASVVVALMGVAYGTLCAMLAARGWPRDAAG